jgi:GNAT superfamily N-acetyltransferase
MYVDATARGIGLAGDLLRAAEDHARAAGAQRLVLWTDTRFTRAHGFYEKQGYMRQGSIRILDDISNSLEFRYAKPARGLVVEALDAAAAARAERRLADLLITCVAEDASLEFLPPLSRERAVAFWKQTSAAVAAGARVLLVAWRDGVMAGSVTLDLATAQNQSHAAAIQKLLVDPAARRAGLGRALMRRAEQAARGHGRTLLSLDTRAGSAAEGGRLRGSRSVGSGLGAVVAWAEGPASGAPRGERGRSRLWRSWPISSAIASSGGATPGLSRPARPGWPPPAT